LVEQFSNDKQKPQVESFSETFTTAEVNFFPSLTKGKVAIRAVIDNQDPTNALTFVKNGRGGTVFTLPPNSLAIIDNEILEAIVITPNATTGIGQLTADLASREELISGGFLTN